LGGAAAGEAVAKKEGVRLRRERISGGGGGTASRPGTQGLLYGLQLHSGFPL